jgi:hypothetical protein
LRIYILTDAVWQPLSDPIEPITSFITTLKDSAFPQNQVGIQFISFGNDLDGIFKLGSLNSELFWDVFSRRCKRDIYNVNRISKIAWIPSKGTIIVFVSVFLGDIMILLNLRDLLIKVNTEIVWIGCCDRGSPVQSNQIDDSQLKASRPIENPNSSNRIPLWLLIGRSY